LGDMYCSQTYAIAALWIDRCHFRTKSYDFGIGIQLVYIILPDRASLSRKYQQAANPDILPISYRTTILVTCSHKSSCSSLPIKSDLSCMVQPGPFSSDHLSDDPSPPTSYTPSQHLDLISTPCPHTSSHRHETCWTLSFQSSTHYAPSDGVCACDVFPVALLRSCCRMPGSCCFDLVDHDPWARKVSETMRGTGLVPKNQRRLVAVQMVVLCD